VIGVAAFLWIVPGLLALTWFVREAWLELAPGRVSILSYHRLISRAEVRAGRVRDDEPMWACYDDVFAAQLDALAAGGFTTIDLDDWLEIRSGRRAAPARPVVLTFDDGYRSNYELAYPLLRARGLKAVIFVALEPDAHTRRQVAGIDGFLDASQLGEMAGHGISIQSHSLTHRILTELDDDAIRRELGESRRRLEAIVARPVRHFCVPRAGGDERVRRLVREAGYASSCGGRRGTATRRSDPFDLPRIAIERDMGVDAFQRALEPLGALSLRIAGEVKVLPARLLGARRARALRDRLYTRHFASWFGTPRLARTLLSCGALYAAAAIALLWTAC